MLNRIAASAFAAALGSSSSLEPRHLTAAPDSRSAPSMPLSEIKALAAANADMMAKGKDIPGYEDCVRTRFEYDALYGNRPPESETELRAANIAAQCNER